ncbi:hypothetical protein IWX50DRAFT_689111 [Phyllosticta citricarpa]|uniref:Bromodomain-containing protein n=1 Tax=Phyllosticta citricarpa TaxID=55181 RepID=A0ABR1MQR6_9PEZI
MAVMTSPATDKPSLDAKPVPSADTMALDSNINGANDHDPLFDEDPTPHLDLPDPPLADTTHNTVAATNGNSATNGTSPAPDALHVKDSLPAPAGDGNGDIAPTAPILAENPPDVPQTLPPAPDSLTTTTQPPSIDQPASNDRKDLTDATSATDDDVKPPVEMGEQDSQPPTEPAQSAPAVETAPADVAPSAPPAPPAVESTAPTNDVDSKMDISEEEKVEAHAPAATLITGGSDHLMEDAPAMTKTRPREDDEDEGGPSAKRARTAEGTAEAEAKPADAPTPAAVPTTNGNPAQPPKPAKIETNNVAVPTEAAPTTPAISNAPEKKKYDQAELTLAQHKFLMDRLRGAKKTKSAAPFLHPVDPVTLNIPHYPQIIQHPMDLGTMESKLRDKKYQSVDDFMSDFYLMIDNCITFNGTAHPIAQTAWNLQVWFERGMHLLPARDAQAEPPKRTKKSSNGPPKARRESRAHVPAHSPKDSNTPTVTYALQADGTPLIRRDSTTGDGRPKREIHRPPPKDLPYTNPRPKSKKSQLELKFCDMVVNEMLKPKHQVFSYPFLAPVDPIALNIPQYLKIIKKPIDLGTIASRLKHGEYNGAKEVKADIELMFANCFKFNPEGDEVNKMGHLFQDLFKRTWEKKADWLAQHAPASEPESEEDEEEEEEESDGEDEEAIRQRQAEIAQQIMKLTQEQLALQNKKKSSPKYSGKKSAKKEKESKPKKASKPALPLKPKKKQRQITFEEKRLISETIGNLDENQMARAVQIIRNGVPSLQGVNDDELELDIDTIPNDVLHDLLKYIKTVAPDSIVVNQQPVAQDDDYEPPARKAQAQPRKNKPMGKHEQEAAIADIKQRLQNFTNRGSSDDASPEPAALHRDDSDDDDSSASESEEE